jgi:hypothetical protein
MRRNEIRDIVKAITDQHGIRSVLVALKEVCEETLEESLLPPSQSALHMGASVGIEKLIQDLDKTSKYLWTRE